MVNLIPRFSRVVKKNSNFLEVFQQPVPFSSREIDSPSSSTIRRHSRLSRLKIYLTQIIRRCSIDRYIRHILSGRSTVFFEQRGRRDYDAYIGRREGRRGGGAEEIR